MVHTKHALQNWKQVCKFIACEKLRCDGKEVVEYLAIEVGVSSKRKGLLWSNSCTISHNSDCKAVWRCLYWKTALVSAFIWYWVRAKWSCNHNNSQKLATCPVLSKSRHLISSVMRQPNGISFVQCTSSYTPGGCLVRKRFAGASQVYQVGLQQNAQG